MNFRETSRRGHAVHAAAIQQRDDASEGYDLLAGLATAAVGSPSEDDAADLRDAARGRLAAREAWVGWIEHGVVKAPA